jgi:hypothetical protein
MAAYQLDEMREQYMNVYTVDNIMNFYKIAANKKNFNNVFVNGENPEDNYFLDIEKRTFLLELIESNNVNRNQFREVLLMLTNEELSYIGF